MSLCASTQMHPHKPTSASSASSSIGLPRTSKSMRSGALFLRARAAANTWGGKVHMVTCGYMLKSACEYEPSCLVLVVNGCCAMNGSDCCGEHHSYTCVYLHTMCIPAHHVFTTPHQPTSAALLVRQLHDRSIDVTCVLFAMASQSLATLASCRKQLDNLIHMPSSSLVDKSCTASWKL